MFKYLLLLTFMGAYLSLSAQCDFTFRKNQSVFVIEHFDYQTCNRVILDTLEVQYCSMLGDKLYTLDRYSYKISTPASVFLRQYDLENGKMIFVNEREIHPTFDMIQNKFSLNGGYLQIESLRSLKFPNIKPSGFLQPFKREYMIGEKKIKQIFLNELDSFNIQEVLKDFNDW